MSGFPTRPGRASFGPTYQEDRPVTDPQRELGADVVNLLFWQLAGIGLVSPKAIIKASVSGAAVSNDYQALAFDPKSQVSAIPFTYEGAGRYSFLFDSQYPNEKDVDVNLNLVAGIAMPISSSAVNGTHTGADNQATLTDSTKSWTVNELAGKIIYNLTDGSYGTIASNTADTVTATLGGGSENDWDTDDEYVILPTSLSLLVNLTSGYAGDIFCVDSSGILSVVDVENFILILW